MEMGGVVLKKLQSVAPTIRYQRVHFFVFLFLLLSQINFTDKKFDIFCIEYESLA